MNVEAVNGLYPSNVLVDAVAATGAGAWTRVKGLRTFQVIGTFVGTVAIEVSNNKTDAETMFSTTTTGGWESGYPWAWVRANVTAYTSGTITVIVNYDGN